MESGDILKIWKLLGSKETAFHIYIPSEEYHGDL